MYKPSEHAEYIMWAWMQKNLDGTQPLVFSDALAELFFFATLSDALRYAYRAGKGMSKNAISAKRLKDGKRKTLKNNTF